MIKSLPAEINTILSFACEEAMRLGNNCVTADHLFLGILRYGDCGAVRILSRYGADLSVIKKKIESAISKPDFISYDNLSAITLSGEIKQVLSIALGKLAADGITPDSSHLLAAIVLSTKGVTAAILKEYGIDQVSVLSDVSQFQARAYEERQHRTHGVTNQCDASGNIDNPGRADSESGHASNKSAEKEQTVDRPDTTSADTQTPMLDRYSYDLTRAASEGALDPVVGREAQIERLAQVLCRRKKNNPVLIGEPGVGKSTIVEGLAECIVQRRAPEQLLDKRILSLNMGSVLAGAKYRGQFEERIQGIINELKQNRNTIVFIDEIHTIIGAGSPQGSLDAANMLKPALARGFIRCIGATTADEYRETIEKDGALERRFQKIIVEQTSEEQTMAILLGIRERYGNFHSTTYTDEALKACINLSCRYIPERFLPDKAIDILDEAGARTHSAFKEQNLENQTVTNELKDIRCRKREAVLDGDFRKAAGLRDLEKEKMALIENIGRNDEVSVPQRAIVDADQIAEVVSIMTGIPAGRLASSESLALMNMESALKKVIVGQDEAVSKVVKAIRRSRAGLKDADKPTGSFLFLGPTGVGKTQLAKKIAELLFGSADSLIRIDMSEYLEKYSASRLIGAPPGYVGYNEGGQLSERVRRKPYSVVLLDEIEKAHPDIFNILLQVLDEGRLTDSAGRHIDFRNTIVILTSNIGSRQVMDFGEGIGFTTKATDTEGNRKSIINKALNRTFPPEFINRLDDVIYFNSLTERDIEQIADIETAKIRSRMESLGYSLVIDKDARKFIAREGYDSKYGARPLRRALQRYVEDPLADAIINRSNKSDGGKGKKKTPAKEITVRISLNGDGNDTLVSW